jgi:hypothetical protein
MPVSFLSAPFRTGTPSFRSAEIVLGAVLLVASLSVLWMGFSDAGMLKGQRRMSKKAGLTRKWRRFEDLPPEIVLMITEELSIRDMCYLRAVRLRSLYKTTWLTLYVLKVSRKLRVVMSGETIWRVALRDILEVKPIPRLQYALESMSPSDLRNTCVRLATQEMYYKSSGDRPLQLLSEFEPNHSPRASAVPGGDYFVTRSADWCTLMLYSTLFPNENKGVHLIPNSEQEIEHWRMIPVSANEVLVLAVYKVKQAGHRYALST